MPYCGQSGPFIKPRLTNLPYFIIAYISSNSHPVNEYTKKKNILLMLIIWLMHPYVYIVYEIMPKGILKIVEAVVIALFFIDLFVTLAVSLKWKLKGDIYENVASSLEKTKLTIGEKVFEHIKRRMYKAFPEMESQTKSDTDGFGVPHNRVFAQGMCFDKLFWVFFICALLGDWIETVFVWATAGQLMTTHLYQVTLK